MIFLLLQYFLIIKVFNFMVITVYRPSKAFDFLCFLIRFCKNTHTIKVLNAHNTLWAFCLYFFVWNDRYYNTISPISSLWLFKIYWRNKCHWAVFLKNFHMVFTRFIAIIFYCPSQFILAFRNAQMYFVSFPISYSRLKRVTVGK